MAVVVENLPADADTRLRKQLRDLLSHGYRVSVITQAGRGTARITDSPFKVSRTEH